MNFFKEIEDIRKKIFTEQRVETLLAAYQAGLRERGLEMWEVNYAEAKAALPAVLSGEQQAELAEVEAGGMDNLHTALCFAFPRGLFAAFQQHFAGEVKGDAFDTLVLDQLETEPRHRCGIGLLDWQGKWVERFEAFRAEADDGAKAHLDAVLDVWDERAAGILRYGFYLGYCFALSMLEDILPAEALGRMDQHVLLTEFGLELTGTRWGREHDGR